MSTFTPFGTYRNDPPDQIAPCSAENLLSWGGTHRHEYAPTSSSCSVTAVSIAQKMIPRAAYSSLSAS